MCVRGWVCLCVPMNVSACCVYDHGVNHGVHHGLDHGVHSDVAYDVHHVVHHGVDHVVHHDVQHGILHDMSDPCDRHVTCHMHAHHIHMTFLSFNGSPQPNSLSHLKINKFLHYLPKKKEDSTTLHSFLKRHILME